MADHLDVMISSTARDLPLHRKQVESACKQLGMFPYMMEDLPASDKDAQQVSRELVQKAEIYVGIFAHRYGYVPKGQELSITEMEYNHAIQLGKPRLIFLMHDDHPIKGSDVEKGPGAAKLEALKKRLETERVVQYFKSPEDLRAHVLHALTEARNQPGQPVGLTPEGQREAYLQSLAESCRWIDLGGLAPQVGGELLRLPLDEVFIRLQAERDVPLTEEFAREEFLLRRELEEEGAAPEELARRLDHLTLRARKAEEARTTKRERVDVGEVLQHRHVVVLGDPGSGKTTLLRYLTRTVALRDPRGVLPADLDLFPVYLRLGRYEEYCDRHPATSLIDYVPRAAEERGLALPADLLTSEAAQDRCLFLLDGLDEIVHTGRRAEVRDRVRELAQRFPRCRVVVTSRIVGYRDAQLPGGDDGFAHFTLCPFDDESIQSFAEHWYDAIRTHGPLTDPERQNAATLAEGIHANPGVRRLAANPLLLTLIALVYWREVRLPRRRVELYKMATQMLLAKWLQTRPQEIELSEREATTLLMAVAFHLHETSSAGLISRADLENVLVRLKTDKDRGGLAELQAEKEVETFLKTEGEHVGLLYCRGYDDRNREVFGFLHLTFEEYLAGRELARLWKQGKVKLADYLHRPRWEEPVLLACSHLSDEDDETVVNRFVSEILEADSPYERELHRDLLLAARCLGEDAYVSRDMVDKIFVSLDEVFVTTITSLNHRIREVAGGMRDSRICSDASSLLIRKLLSDNMHLWSFAAGALGQMGVAAPPVVVSILLDRLKYTDQNARFAAAGALGQLGTAQPEVIAGLLDRLADAAPYEQHALVIGLGELGTTAVLDEVVATLFEYLVNVKGFLRSAAAGALGRLGIAAAQPKVVSALLDCLGDSKWQVRTAAAESLGQLGESAARPEVIAALVDRLKDPEDYAREAAVRALGRLGESAARPQVVDALLDRLNDFAWSVRDAAADALGQLGEQAARPELVATLLDRLGNAKWKDRSATIRALGELKVARPEVIAILLGCLTDSYRSVRYAAAAALGQLGETAARPEVVTALVDQLDDLDWNVRCAVVSALGRLGSLIALPEVVTGLLDSLSDPEGNVQSAAASSLGRLGKAAATKPILDRLAAMLREPEARDGPRQNYAFEALSQLVQYYRPPSQPEPT